MIKTLHSLADRVAQVVECLPGKCKALSSTPKINKLIKLNIAFSKDNLHNDK
jgi:hypothetical protein